MDKYKNKDGISLSYATNGVNIENSDNINYNRNVHTELVKEVISESIKILNMCDKNCKISMGIAMSNTKKFLRTNFSIEIDNV